MKDVDVLKFLKKQEGSDMAKQTVFVNEFTNGILGPEVPMLFGGSLSPLPETPLRRQTGPAPPPCSSLSESGRPAAAAAGAPD